MNAKTRLSAKGQVVIPKDVRDALGLKPGQELEVTQAGGGVLLRRVSRKSGRSFEEITAAIRSEIQYDGPPLSMEDIRDAAAEGWAEHGRRDGR